MIRSPIERLRELEIARCDSPDRTADQFGILMRDVAADGLSGDKKQIAEQCGYHIGRFVYLIDAFDDLLSDEKSGSYNPFLLRYGSAEEAMAHKEEIVRTLEDSMRVFSHSYALACPPVLTGIDRIIFNISDLGGRESVRRVEQRLLSTPEQKGASHV